MADETTNTTSSDHSGKSEKKRKKHGFWATFGFVIMIIAAAIVILALIYFILWMLFSNNNTTTANTAISYSEAVDLDEEQAEYMNRYTAAVNTAKGEKDFNLNVTTDAGIYNVECSVSFFQTLINAMMNTMNTEIFSDIDYHFKNGKDGTATPMSIIQPGYTTIPEGSFGGISAVTGTTTGSNETIKFTVAAESMDFEEMMLLTDGTTAEQQQEIIDEYNADDGNYDDLLNEIRDLEQYRALVSMVPNHMNYVDAISVINLIMSGFSAEDEDDDSAENNTEFNMSGDVISLNDGTLTFNDMQFTATLNDGLLEEVDIVIPITINMNLTFFGRDIEISFSAGVNQGYSFSY